MTIKNNFKTLLIPIYLLVLIMGQSCASVQRMRYTRGLHIDITTFGKKDKKKVEYKHALTSKKYEYKKLVCKNKNRVIDLEDAMQMSTLAITTNSQNLQRKVNNSLKAFSFNVPTTPIAELKQKIRPKLTKTSDASLLKISHKAKVNHTSEGNLSRGKIMLIALSTNLLAVIGLFALTTIIGGSNIIGLVIAGACATFGVAFAGYGFEEAQNDTFAFLLLYALASLPGFIINSIILIILGVTIA
jgi:hypothetical protein